MLFYVTQVAENDLWPQLCWWVENAGELVDYDPFQSLESIKQNGKKEIKRAKEHQVLQRNKKVIASSISNVSYVVTDAKNISYMWIGIWFIFIFLEKETKWLIYIYLL